MTSAPITIAAKDTLTDAHTVMRHARIRHLPVLEGKKLVGVVSQSDLRLIETLRDVDPEEVTVREAMSKPPYTVSPAAHLDTVCGMMARRRIGATVVMRRGSPVGVFTAVDALRALATLLAPAGKKSARRR